MNLSRLKTLASSRTGLATSFALGAAAATAVWVELRARQAERQHPPTGQFIDLEGVRLHYIERGEGPPVVLLHGNMVSLADFEASGLIDRLALTHRVIAFDRPGFGHSTRPRDRLWTPAAQAALLHAALERLGVERPVVVGHSMGTLVALALALDYPGDVSGLVLLGGYYYPSARLDAILTAPVALPVLGDAMRYTVTAISARLFIERAVEAMFWPNEVPHGFYRVLSREMMLRPVQLRANAEDAAFMIPAAASGRARYRALEMPVTIIAGNQDKVVDPQDHSARLHEEVLHSELVVMPEVGHMVHHVWPETVVDAVAQVSTEAGRRGR
jgi:pimeloyl-ACP methyl ester carboxylesterase